MVVHRLRIHSIWCSSVLLVYLLTTVNFMLTMVSVAGKGFAIAVGDKHVIHRHVKYVFM